MRRPDMRAQSCQEKPEKSGDQGFDEEGYSREEGRRDRDGYARRSFRESACKAGS